MKRKYKFFIIILVLFISIGFAYLSTNLSIIGLTSVKSNKWDIHFENVQVSAGSVDVEPVIDTNKTSVNYSFILNKPGDFVEFTVDAVNSGSLDGMIKTIDKTNLTTEQQKYLDYFVKYKNMINLNENDLLAAGESVTYIVRVEYKIDINNDDMPSTDSDVLNFNLSVEYEQADENAFELPHSVKFIIHNTGYNPLTSENDSKIINFGGYLVSKDCVDNNNCTLENDNGDRIYRDDIEFIINDTLTSTNVPGTYHNHICSNYDDDNYLCFEHTLIDSIKNSDLDYYFDGFGFVPNMYNGNSTLKEDKRFDFRAFFNVKKCYNSQCQYTQEFNRNYFADLYDASNNGVINLYPILEYVAS